MTARDEYDLEYWEKYSVTRPRQPLALVDRFEQLIDSDPKEADVQAFLAENPWLLTEQFPHCHYLIPQFRLGDLYVADFIAPERHSGGPTWMLIEIERPKSKLVTSRGELAETVRHAVQQVSDWRSWLLRNMDVARRPRSHGGLGLGDMSELLAGNVIVGRRVDVTSRFNDLRADILNRQAISIMTYDRIVEFARKRAEFWESYGG